MRTLIKFLLKYYYFLLFLLFELFSVLLVIENNNYQKSSFLNSANSISGNIYKSVSSFKSYIDLYQKNETLSAENSRLYNSLKSSFKSNKISLLEIYDSTYFQQYVTISAHVINNSVNRQNNYLTIDKGKKHGVSEEMAVISPTGIVGIIKNVSNNYASVISILNTNLHISAMIKKNDYFGSLVWDGKNYRETTLKDIPNHVKINIGDTIITSGYSSIFPKGKLIGVISDFEHEKGGNFYLITVKLSTDFKKLSYVYVVGNLLKQEQKDLEKISEND
ncbi:MAG: rod shape-determining protein MreC [Bacteroidetes bacterium]|nr:MAG: rod shape-determining protein MreC [Bacteroidota bacterium]